MNIESMIGIAYCLVAMIFLIGKTVGHLQRRYYEPGDLLTAFAWPLLIVLWLIQRRAK